MNNLIFDSLVLYIPTAFVLYLLGHIVYTLAEYQSRIHTIPKTLMYVGVKGVSIILLQIFSYYYKFSANNIEHFQIISFLISGYIIFEASLTILMLNQYIEYLEKFAEKVIKHICYKDFDIIISKITKRMLKCYQKPILVLKVLFSVLFGLLLLFLQFQYSLYIFGLFLIVTFLISINFSIIKS